jgi:hypothetical protein
VNCYYKDFKGLKASAKIFDFNIKEVWTKETEADVVSDDSKKIMTVDVPGDITKVYFLKLDLMEESGKEVSSNFYWLSSNGDEKADFTDLGKLPMTDVKVSASAIKKEDNKYVLSVTIENPGTGLAFAVNPKILKKTSLEPVLPVFWDDNYISLLPGEKRTISVEFYSKNLGGEDPVLKVDGWNVRAVVKELK